MDFYKYIYNNNYYILKIYTLSNTTLLWLETIATEDFPAKQTILCALNCKLIFFFIQAYWIELQCSPLEPVSKKWQKNVQEAETEGFQGAKMENISISNFA